MKLASSIFVLTTLAAILPAQAQSGAVTDPLKIIYKASGLLDNGGASAAGVATSMHCTNFGNVDERVRFLVRQSNGAATSQTTTVGAGQTVTASTHNTNIFGENITLTTGTSIRQGALAISSSSTTNVFCSAMIVDANSQVPVGIALHLVRFNPAPGTQE
jgi:hypothetical protein